MNKRRIMNADNTDLQPINDRIGHVDSVNGNGAREVAEFVPTRAELVELAKYWEATFLQRKIVEFEFDQTGSTDLRLVPFAERRVIRIIDLVGSDAVEAVREVQNEFMRRVGARVWNKFCEYLGPLRVHGTTVDKDDQRSDVAATDRERLGPVLVSPQSPRGEGSDS